MGGSRLGGLGGGGGGGEVPLRGVLHSVHGQKTLYNTPKTKKYDASLVAVRFFLGGTRGNAFFFISLSRPANQTSHPES